MENIEYRLKCRGFEIVGEKNEGLEQYNPNTLKCDAVGGVDIVIYKVKDKEHANQLYSGKLILGHRLADYSKKAFVMAARGFINDYYVALAF